MNRRLRESVLLGLCLGPAIYAALAPGRAGADDPPTGSPAPQAPARPTDPVPGIPGHHFEPTGLSLLRPYERGKVPVVLVHGLWGSPLQFAAMIAALEADPALRARYQFWTFGYSTGDPIPYSAHLLRRALREARAQLDPGRDDAAFDRTVVVGHSMGGLLAKMLAQDSRTRLWELIATVPPDRLEGDAAHRELLRAAMLYKPLPEVRRVVFIATPHRGARIDAGPVRRVGTRLIRQADPLRATHAALLARNGPDAFTPTFRQGLPTSVEQLAWEHPLLLALAELGCAAGVDVRSIVADLRDPPRPGGGDGIVPYESAHLDGPAPEVLVSAGHLCLDCPAVIRAVAKILGAAPGG